MKLKLAEVEADVQVMKKKLVEAKEKLIKQQDLNSQPFDKQDKVESKEGICNNYKQRMKELKEETSSVNADKVK